MPMELFDGRQGLPLQTGRTVISWPMASCHVRGRQRLIGGTRSTDWAVRGLIYNSYHARGHRDVDSRGLRVVPWSPRPEDSLPGTVLYAVGVPPAAISARRLPTPSEIKRPSTDPADASVGMGHPAPGATLAYPFCRLAY